MAGSNTIITPALTSCGTTCSCSWMLTTKVAGSRLCAASRPMSSSARPGRKSPSASGSIRHTTCRDHTSSRGQRPAGHSGATASGPIIRSECAPHHHPEWPAWLRRGGRSAAPALLGSIGCKALHLTDTGGPQRQVMGTEPSKGCREAAGDFNQSDRARIRAGGLTG
jgi:hypothetical protein